MPVVDALEQTWGAMNSCNFQQVLVFHVYLNRWWLGHSLINMRHSLNTSQTLLKNILSSLHEGRLNFNTLPTQSRSGNCNCEPQHVWFAAYAEVTMVLGFNVWEHHAFSKEETSPMLTPKSNDGMISKARSKSVRGRLWSRGDVCQSPDNVLPTARERCDAQIMIPHSAELDIAWKPITGFSSRGEVTSTGGDDRVAQKGGSPYWKSKNCSTIDSFSCDL